MNKGLLVLIIVCMSLGYIQGDYSLRVQISDLETSLKDKSERLEGAMAHVLRLQKETLLQERILDAVFNKKIVIDIIQSKEVTATAYTARIEECDITPEVTSSMNPSRIGAIAVSRDLELIGLTLGSMVIVEGMGVFKIEDRMNKRFTNRIDILHANVKAANLFGSKNVKITWL